MQWSKVKRLIIDYSVHICLLDLYCLYFYFVLEMCNRHDHSQDNFTHTHVNKLPPMGGDRGISLDSCLSHCISISFFILFYSLLSKYPDSFISISPIPLILSFSLSIMKTLIFMFRLSNHDENYESWIRQKYRQTGLLLCVLRG